MYYQRFTICDLSNCPYYARPARTLYHRYTTNRKVPLLPVTASPVLLIHFFKSEATKFTKYKMESTYKTLNGVQTHLITHGAPFSNEGRDVVICVTGNPGVSDFYIEFASALEENTGFSVCVIGQAGHEEVPDQRSNILKGQEYLFDLKGQIEHKLDLIDNYIDKKSNIHLIGHSIGAWLIVELLHKNKHLTERVKSINLLFPTLQKMAETKNGLFLNNILRRFNAVAILLVTLLHLLPPFITLPLINAYLKLNKLPAHYSNRVQKFLNPKVVEKVLFLAYNEMDQVKELNMEAVARIKHLINVVYSPSDNWAPVSYINDLDQFQPTLQMKEVNVDHSFVLKSSDYIAEIVSDFIKSKT